MPSNPGSILDSVKKVLGLNSDYTEFDIDVTMHTNMALATLTQLGVGPSTGYSIDDSTSQWTDFTPQHYLLGPVRSFVYLSVRLIFDPPSTSFVIEAIEKQIAELGWRINVMAEQPPIPSGVFVANWYDLTGMTDFPSGWIATSAVLVMPTSCAATPATPKFTSVPPVFTGCGTGGLAGLGMMMFASGET